MVQTVTTGWTDSARVEIAQGVHDFTPAVTTANNVTTSNASPTMSGINSADIGLFRVGATLTGASIAAGTVVGSIDSASQITMSKNATGTSTTITIGGGTFKILLLKGSGTLSRNYARDQSNVGTPGTAAGSATNVGTDEVAASGSYSAGGSTVAMETGAPKVTASSGAYFNLSAAPNWTSFTGTSLGCIVYSSRAMQGSSNGITANASGSALNKALTVHSFTTDQTATNGTFTVTMPTSSFAAAMFAIG